MGLYLTIATYDRSTMQLFAPEKEFVPGKKWWNKSVSPWGDLTKMAMLDDVKQFQERKDYAFTKPADSGMKNIQLYLYGDSYTEDVPGFAFTNIGSFHFGRRNVGLFYELDSTKHNILIIETSERFVRGSYDDDGIYYAVKRKEKDGKVKQTTDDNKPHSAIVNNNLEHLMFEYNGIAALRRAKAEMNYSMFHRASGDVVISDNDKYLFFRPVMATSGAFSYLVPVNNNLINYYVRNLNKIYDHYRKEGFDEVYFSIIPNPSSILQPSGYNQLIPKLNNAGTALKMPLLDLYNIFKSSQQPDTFYRRGDTHWNNKGMQTWLHVVNNVLRTKSKEIEEKDRKYDIAK